MTSDSANRARSVLHVLGSADWDGSATAKMVELLARTVDPALYCIHACFLGTPGPLLDALREPCASADILPLRGGVQRILDVAGLARYCRRLGIGIVHQHFGGRMVSLAAKAARARVVLHVHGYIDERRGFDPISPRVLPGVDAVIANSRATAETVHARNLRVIYPAVPILPDRPPASSAQLVIGTAARLVTVKGLDVLVNAVARLIHSGYEVELQIAGSGPLQPQLERAAAALGISERVHFLGWVRDLPSVMQGWTIFVLPSLQEAFGIAVLDAMAAGLPVVASNVGGIPEIVVENVTGRLVEPGAVAALERALAELLSDARMRAHVGAAGQRRAREIFSPSRMATEISAVYDQLA